ncbi:MAG: TMEM175 family protein [Suipraeoptans sp.]
MSKSRLEAFTDAIIAIIMTILVLELKTPKSATLQGLWDIRYQLIIYLISFLSLAVYWNNHHHLLQIAQKIDGRVMWCNIFFILGLSFFPFAASWINTNIGSLVPELFYGFVVLFTNIFYLVLAKSLVHANGKDSQVAQVMKGYKKPAITLSINTIGILLAFVIPAAVFVSYVISMIFWVVPERKIEKKFQK